MTILLKQSTAFTWKAGPFVDSLDGVTPETGLSITQAEVRLSKNGGDFAQKNTSNTATHDEEGWYDVSLDTTDTGTLGRLRAAVYVSGALPVWENFLVVPANVYDSLCSTDYLQIDVIQLLGTAWLTPGTAGTPDVNVKLFGGTTQTTGKDVSSIVDAVKTKTDNLPASPAAVGSQMDLVNGPNATALNAIADALLNRDMSAGTDTNSRTPRNAFRAIVNKWTVAAGVLTVYKENDSTTAWTANLTGDGDASPITGSDPS